MEGTWSKEMRKIVDQIRMPSGQCQACLSDKSPDKDFMITCTLCQSSIHNKHYGREIDESSSNLSYDKWKCERCRMLLHYQSLNKLQEAQKIQCHFCPNTRGILKRVIYNSNETIWLHPECSTWPYPIIYQKNNRRIHYNCEYPTRATGRFWVNLQDQDSSECQICKKKQGYKIKCMYYTCHKYYHCSCAKSVGVIRDLESMQFQNSDTYIPPYCQQHLEARIEDCSAKARKYRLIGDEAKASNFSQMMSAYQLQLKNMSNSIQKHRNEQEIRKQMQYQTGEKEDILQDLDFQSREDSFHSIHDQSFLHFIFDQYHPSHNHQNKHSFLFCKGKPSIKQAMVAETVKVGEEIPVQDGKDKKCIDKDQIDIKENEGGKKLISLYTGKNQIGQLMQSEPEGSEWSVSQFEDGRMSDQ